MLGEPGTEQFEVITEVAGETVHRLKIHDPFIRTTTTVRGFAAAWKCLFGGLRVVTRINGSNGAMSAVMMLDPKELARFDSQRGVAQAGSAVGS
jgi:hypothetical protein